MPYSLNNVSTVADCNVLLSMAAKEMADLEFKRISTERLTTRFAETSISVAAELQGVTAEISATDTIISILPEGPAKEDAVDKKTRLEYRKFLLESRAANYGVTALLEKEMDLSRVRQEIGEVELFVAEVEARIVVLSA
ncbi:MAG: hypothetical protein EOO01_33610 [Chitinophagaceae bacterium]|nr:MAG: hypothetical protein EOO01_33610 [Chitinophagaceae bacterium]